MPEDDLESLVNVMPARVRDALITRENLADLIEVILDLGRLPEARFPDEQILLDTDEVTHDDIQWVIRHIGQFGDDNRAGIERTLHRFSVVPNRTGLPVGLTCRVGRAVFGTIRVIEDFVFNSENILLMGKPGIGKTTMLREIARVLADDAGRRVVIVDTSNEIAGDGDVPHPGIGSARRMQVPSTPLQHHVMIEAVENHMPEVIIIDEMSTELEAIAARTIAERGVQLIATAHGNTLENLVSNPSLSDLVGGTHTVTLGDIEARRRRTQKTVLERKYQPTFNVVVEIRKRNAVGVHWSVGRVVDDMLRGYPTQPELRMLDNTGNVRVNEQGPESQNDTEKDYGKFSIKGITTSDEELPTPVTTRIAVFGIARPMIASQAEGIGAAVDMVSDLEQADVLVTTKAHYSRRPTAVRLAERSGMPVYVLRKGSSEQVKRFLKRFSQIPGRKVEDKNLIGHRTDIVTGQPLNEARNGVRRILSGEHSVKLAPQSSYIRRLQHNVANQNKVGSVSVGAEPERRIILRRRRQ